MGQGKLTDPLVQQEVLELSLRGVSPMKIREKLKISRSTVYEILSHGKIKNSPQMKSTSGRKTKIGKAEMTRINKILKTNDRSSLKIIISKAEINVSKSTLSRALSKRGVKRMKKKCKEILTNRHKTNRVTFAEEHVSKFDWTNVIFSDEKKFNVDGPDGYNYQWVLPNNLQQTFSAKTKTKKSVMVWGAITSTGTLELAVVDTTLNSEKYQSLLHNNLLPKYKKKHVFMQDGASCHRSKSTKTWLKKKKVLLLENWPAKSPDLNPIENCWAWMVRDLYIGKEPYESVKNLKEAIFESWKRIPSDFIAKLYNSMHDRMNAVIRVNGERIKY